MIKIKDLKLFETKEKKQIECDNVIKNNYAYLNILNLEELTLIKYKCEVNSKKSKNTMILYTIISTIITIMLSLISIKIKSVENLLTFDLCMIVVVYIVYILIITYIGIGIKKDLDLGSEYEVISIMVNDKITKIKAQDWNKAQLVKTQIIENDK